MTISYINNRGDLMAFQLHRLRRSPLIFVVNAACLTFMAFLFSQASRDVAQAPRIVATVFFLLLLLPILLAVQVGIVALGLALRTKEAPAPEQVTLSESGIRVETATSCQDYQWRGISKVCHTRRQLFIYLTPSIACLVPRRAFASAHEWESFKEFCICRVT